MLLRIHLSWLAASTACAFVLTVGPLTWAQTTPPDSPVESDAAADQNIASPTAISPTAISQNQEVESELDGAGVQYLTRGPLHEAFATPYNSNPEPSETVQQEPPAPIEEVRPDLRPEGNDVQWISGYWAFDDEKKDFIWISGLWRDVPPKTRWVPGYWTEVENGFLRVSGFWSSAEADEIAYLPPPPESLEEGPSSPAPGENYFYIPGTWVYQSNDYAWRPGIWATQHEDWVWTPASYVWTPRGCIYRSGYWDYEPTYRGVVFTPVYYDQPVYRQPNYRYHPQYVVNTDLALLVHLFVGPRYRNYYYGNYYDAGFNNRYVPWVNYGRNNSNWNYDPLYSYNRYQGNQRGQNITQWVAQRYDFFAQNEKLRPANNLRAQRDLLTRLRNSGGVGENGADPVVQSLATLASDLRSVANSDDRTLRFERIEQAEQSLLDNEMQSQEMMAKRRLDFESQVAANVQPDSDDAASIGLENGGAASEAGSAQPIADAASRVRGRLSLPQPRQDAGIQSDLGLNENADLSAGVAAHLRANRNREEMRRANLDGERGPDSATNRDADSVGRIGNDDPNLPGLRNRDSGSARLGETPTGQDINEEAARVRENLRNSGLPAFRREMDRRSSTLPALPGVSDSSPQSLRGANEALRGLRNRSDATRGNMRESNPGAGNPGGILGGGRPGNPGLNNAGRINAGQGNTGRGNSGRGNAGQGAGRGNSGLGEGIRGAAEGAKSALPK